MTIQELIETLEASDAECVTITLKRRPLREDMIKCLENLPNKDDDIPADIENEEGEIEVINSSDLTNSKSIRDAVFELFTLEDS